MNLSTARYENRAKEVGVRKTIGAGHRSLIAQFLVESLFIAFVAGVVALIAVHLLLPYFNVLTERELTINYNSLEYWSVMLGVVIFAGFMAGSYPAFFLSSFKPVLVLKGSYISNRSSVTVRRALVVFQYAFTIILAIAALVIREQINFTQERETGFLKDRLIFHTISGDLNKNYAAYREELISSGVATSVTKTYSPLIEQWSSTPGIQWQGKDPSSEIVFDRFGADEDLVATAGLQLIAGRDIDLSRFSNDSSAALINEAAAQVMNFDNPVGERFTDSGKEWTIVGVIKDFIARSPYQKPAPMVIEGSKTGWFYVIHVRLSEDLPLTDLLEKASSTFKKYNPDYPFEYHFADVEFDKKFSEEKKIQRLATASTSLAIIISCLGILGLSIHIAHKRTKEIGIRKVFGATPSDLINLLLQEPVKLIAISFVIAVPVTVFLMEEWLERFHYKIDMPVVVFIFVGVGILGMSLLTIGVQTVKSSLTNPTKSLRQQ